MERQICLVFSGGAAKGAYQIGVWKTLVKTGFINKIGPVAGTSVGGLNAALFTQNDLNLAEYLWKKLANDAFFKETFILEKTFKSVFKFKKGNSLFSRDMDNLIQSQFLFDKTKNYPFPVKIACRNKKTKTAVYFNLQNKREKEILAILRATSAVPYVFEEEWINGQYYDDGGLVDNIPWKPLYDEGYRDFIIVNTSNNELARERYDYSDLRMVEIFANLPKKLVDMDLTEETVKKRIEKGYGDTLAAFKKYNNFFYYDNEPFYYPIGYNEN